MQKNYFHNNKISNESQSKKKIHLTQNLNPKIIVDINKLLNRVKIEQRNDTKRKVIFYSSVILVLGIIGTFIGIVK